ncbi:MAG: hypothetical protein WDN30_15440 [Pararobbsia sp.]
MARKVSRCASISATTRPDAYYIDPNTNTVRQNPLPAPLCQPGGTIRGPRARPCCVSGAIIVAIMVAIYVIRVNGVERRGHAPDRLDGDERRAGRGRRQSVRLGGRVRGAAAERRASAAGEPQDVAESLGGNYKVQGIAASLMLALIYLVTQFTAFIVAFKSTFSGQGEAAYDFTRNQPRSKPSRALPATEDRACRELPDATARSTARSAITARVAYVRDFLKRGERREELARDRVIDRVAPTWRRQGRRRARAAL